MKYHYKGIGGRRKKKDVIKQALSPQMIQLMKPGATGAMSVERPRGKCERASPQLRTDGDSQVS